MPFLPLYESISGCKDRTETNERKEALKALIDNKVSTIVMSRELTETEKSKVFLTISN